MKLLINRRPKGIAIVVFLLTLSFTSCKKFIEVAAPVTSINAANVYATDVTAAAVLTAIYGKISNTPLPSGSIASMTLFPALSADELSLFNPASNTAVLRNYYYNNALTSNTSGNSDFWGTIYPVIFVANSAIEGLTASTTLTPSIKQQLLGEAKFVRAFCYFYLVNLYGDVPLAVSSDENINRLLSRTPKAQVYQQILEDLKDAQGLLSDNYLSGDILTASTERVSPNKWVATALLARTYLYTGDYANAEIQSTNIINNSSVYSLSTLNNAFLKASLGNKEAIWQLQPVLPTGTTNTWDAWLFVLPVTGPNISGTYPVYLSNSVINSFETGDNRKTVWINSVTVTGTTYYYPNKYKVNTPSAAVSEFTTIFRLGEQYLIRAEARARLNEATAVNDLNSIRNRAGLANYAGTTDQATLLTAILHERQVELFTEWGHRWLDLKRTGNIDAVMSIITPQKSGVSWNTNWQWYPIPTQSITTDPNLVQNAGY